MNEMGKDFAAIMGRDLAALAAQIGKYPDDGSLWDLSGTIANSGGTLALHLVGNLRHFVGAVLGSTGYVREREAEFATRGVSRADVVAQVHACREEVVAVLEGLGDEAMSQAYPGALPPHLAGTTHRFLLHLAGHLMWHLGQIDYHRRILADGASGATAGG
jgi:hypothetical protein